MRSLLDLQWRIYWPDRGDPLCCSMGLLAAAPFNHSSPHSGSIEGAHTQMLCCRPTEYARGDNDRGRKSRLLMKAEMGGTGKAIILSINWSNGPLWVHPGNSLKSCKHLFSSPSPSPNDSWRSNRGGRGKWCELISGVNFHWDPLRLLIYTPSRWYVTNQFRFLQITDFLYTKVTSSFVSSITVLHALIFQPMIAFPSPIFKHVDCCLFTICPQLSTAGEYWEEKRRVIAEKFWARVASYHHLLALSLAASLTYSPDWPGIEFQQVI